MAGICIEAHCYKKTDKGRKLCPACQAKRWRANNPVKAAYLNKKHDAAKRGIPFNITFKQFKIWCSSNKYMELKGVGPYDLTIDRIKTISPEGEVLGYSIDNIQILTRYDNSVKANQDKKEQWAKKRAIRYPDCPF